MTLRNIIRRPLTPLQQAILDFLWSNGPATSEQVRQGLLPKHPLKDSSIRTVLRRLESQGYVGHKLDGKVFVYRAAVPARSVVASSVRQMIERFCAGSVEQFLIGMVDENVVTADQIERLAQKVRRPG